MATTTTAPTPAPADADAIGQALVDFTLRGLFPENDTTATTPLTPDTLPVAIAALAAEKSRLETDIQGIVAASADDVRAWIDNARALEADMARRKTLASDLLIRGEGRGEASRPDTKSDAAASTATATAVATAVATAEARAQFLTSELNYNLQVRHLLEAIRHVGRLLDQAESAVSTTTTTTTPPRILDALRLLEQAWTALDAMPVSVSCRAVRLLDRRAFDVKSDVHGVLDGVWEELVAIDGDAHTLTVVGGDSDEDGPMRLADVVIAFQAYKEVDKRMAATWHALDAAVVGPRMAVAAASSAKPPGIYIDGATLGLRGTAAPGVDALLDDLFQIFAFLSTHLPRELVDALAAAMVPAVADRLVDGWLVAAVPTALDQMAAFEHTLAAASAFCTGLAEDHLSYSNAADGLGRLRTWIENAPRVWLAKRREAALDQVRADLKKGLGTPQPVERVERQMVSRSEGKELAAATATEQDWDTAWSDEEEAEAEAAVETKAEAAADADDGADDWGAWGDDDNDAVVEEKEKEKEEAPAEAVETNDDDDAADAWGWGDDDVVVDAGEDVGAVDDKTADQPTLQKAKQKTTAAPAPAPEPETRELVLKETYHISALPASVLALVTQLLEDALALTTGEAAGDLAQKSPVAAAAAGLFGVPALVLAMFRAVAPHYYALAVAGSMYLYNDCLYLAEQLAALVTAWTDRLAAADGQATAATAPLTRLGAEAAKLQGFASRAYSREMAVQRTVLRDLLGGDDNVLGGSTRISDRETDPDDYVDAAVARVRSMAAAWDGVLAPSAWRQAVGALADAVAHKLIGDVLDMPAISQDEAFALAQLIRKVVELDDLFLADPVGTGPSPGTSGSGSGSGSGNSPSLPTTAQYAPNWLRLQYLSEVLQSNLREVRYLWMESELSLYFSVAEVLDLIKLSFEDNARSREVARDIAAHPQPVPSHDFSEP